MPHGDHRHGHGGQGAAGRADAGAERRVFQVMLLTGGFMVAEAIGGVLSGSLALLADAGHMLTDAAALALAWAAFRVARRPADARRSYGWHRFEVLAAFVNGLALFAIALWIVVEAIRRLMDPVEVAGGAMLAIAAAGLVVNTVAYALLHGGGANLNVRGAALHVLGDLLGSVAALAAGAVVILTGWTPIDPLLSVVVAGLILFSAWRLVRESGHILLEGTPAGIDPARVGAAVRAGVPGVEDVHHVHAWSLTSERPLVTLHAVIDDSADQNATLAAINGVLHDRFGIDHATVQLERGGCADGTVLDRD